MSRVDDFRDEAARVISTFAFNHIATKPYRNRLTRAIELGLPAAREEERAKLPKFSMRDHLIGLNKEAQDD